jgi:DmsE family decaheme c-type cytochrome
MWHKTFFNVFLYLMAILITIFGFDVSAEAKMKQCTECHDPNISHPIKSMLNSKHWDTSHKATPVNKQGCRSCHGMSESHTNTPTKIQPEISYGPRWASSVEQQNDTCLSCHEKTTTHKQWREGKHASQEVTCITCHDLHTDVDPVRVEKTQANVCTVCHKIQKHGIHNIPKNIAKNPPCSTCHNPHANPLPIVMMLENRSAGCRSCHDFEKMQQDETVTAKAKSYHRVMEKDDRTCVDCHLGVAHVDKDNFGEVLAGGLTTMPGHLFFPGQSDGDWLLAEHKGAQALRQGRNCRQCHFGDTKTMASKLTPKGINPIISGSAAVKMSDNNMVITVSWQGSEDDNSVALMFDNGQVDDFSHQGCWAACHSDLPKMSRDRGQDLKKYLLISQKRKRSVGTPSILHDDASLLDMQKNGQFVELWEVSLSDGTFNSLTRYSILETRSEQPLEGLSAQATFNNGTWTVAFSRPMNDSLKPITQAQQLTFGIAVHGDGESGAQHRVSLPLTISFDGVGTDFILE